MPRSLAHLFADPLDAELHSADQQSATTRADSPSAETPSALTPRQAEVLEFICSYTEETGGVPTIREIGERLGIHSTNGVYSHLHYIARKGYLALPTISGRNRGTSRAYRILRLPNGTPVRVRLVPVT